MRTYKFWFFGVFADSGFLSFKAHNFEEAEQMASDYVKHSKRWVSFKFWEMG